MCDEKWYLGRVSRSRAEELVCAAQIDGSFVVRASESIIGAYALSVWHNGSIHTYRILPTENGLLAVQTVNGVQQRKFVSLTELISEYKSSQNGLVCGLTNPVGTGSTPAPPPPSAAPLPPLKMPTASVSSIPSPLPLTLRTPGAIKVLPILDKNPPLPPQREAPIPNLRSHPSVTRTISETMKDDNKMKNKFKLRAIKLRDAWPHNDHFMDSLEQYASDGIFSDMSSTSQGSKQCIELQKLLAKEAGQLESELEKFLDKIKALRQLVDFDSDITDIQTYSTVNRDVDLESFLTRLGDCSTLVKALNKRSCHQLQLATGSAVVPAPKPSKKVTRKHSVLAAEVFEVKSDAGLKTVRQKLKIDAHAGKLILMKSDGALEFNHQDVMQIVKNNKSQNKLTVLFRGGKKRDFIFEKSTLREAFCQLMQYMINLKSERTEPDFISLFTGTWNMGDAMPSGNISTWFQCAGSGKTLDNKICNIPHDLYVIGTQETGMPEKDWCQHIITTIQDITGEKMHQVTMDALWHIKIVVLVKDEHKHRISHVRSSSVRTGIANTLGNKGAIAISLQFGGTPMCFINAHLTSGNEKCSRRNQNYHDIMKQLSLGNEQLTMFDLANRFEHLFFLGDLNYRLDMGIQEILQHIKSNKLDTLYKVDQLRREKELNKVFFGFQEEEVLFAPTYRYERGNRDVYSHLKIKRTGVRVNVPSWCDRILWKSYPDTHIQCLAYGCTDDIVTSDHSPVFAAFNVGVRGQYVSDQGIRHGPEKSNEATISFEHIDIKLKNPVKNGSYFLEIRSTCLTEAVRSGRAMCEMNNGLGRIHWAGATIPKLHPIISDSEFLVDQHLMVAVRCDEDDYLSECVLALRSVIGTEPQNFEQFLTRKGESSGYMQGRMHVATSGRSPKVREKTYEFIQIQSFRDDSKQQKSIEEPSTPIFRESEGKPSVLSVSVYSDVPKVSTNKSSTSSSPSSTTSRDLDMPLPLPRSRGDSRKSDNLDAIFDEFDMNAEALFYNEQSQQNSSSIGRNHVPPPPSNPAPVLPTATPPAGPVQRENSVEAFLNNIGMSKYISNFLDNGWDSYEFLNDFTDDDLADCGVDETGDAAVIMKAIFNMQP